VDSNICSTPTVHDLFDVQTNDTGPVRMASRLVDRPPPLMPELGRGGRAGFPEPVYRPPHRGGRVPGPAQARGFRVSATGSSDTTSRTCRPAELAPDHFLDAVGA
jgi:hypothetical protein